MNGNAVARTTPTACQPKAKNEVTLFVPALLLNLERAILTLALALFLSLVNDLASGVAPKLRQQERNQHNLRK